MDDNKMSEETPLSVSRRNFIKGVIAAGAVASSSAYLFRTATLHGQPAAAGAVERLITLNVNGQDRRIDLLPQDTLAMTLRYKLGLTGTKLGCDRAECGACTVLVDGVPRYSCSVLAHTVRGKKIVTIEGLADAATGALHPVGVWSTNGLQCAFCMPGFVMATVGYLKTSEPDATGTGAWYLRQSLPLPGHDRSSPR
jgi:aerobic-type carbon monoxide dehydrogenase small subunit (CoxS/CutS family)